MPPWPHTLLEAPCFPPRSSVARIPNICEPPHSYALRSEHRGRNQSQKPWVSKSGPSTVIVAIRVIGVPNSKSLIPNYIDQTMAASTVCFYRRPGSPLLQFYNSMSYMCRSRVRTYKVMHNSAPATSSLALCILVIIEHADHRNALHVANSVQKLLGKNYHPERLKRYSRDSVHESKHDWATLPRQS